MKTQHVCVRPVFPRGRGLRLSVFGLLAALLALVTLAGPAAGKRHLRTKELSNVRATWVSNLDDYALTRIAVLPFLNESDDPIAGDTVAQFVFKELQRRRSLHLLAPEGGVGNTVAGLRFAEVGTALSPQRLQALKEMVQRRVSRALKRQADGEQPAARGGSTSEELEPETSGTFDAVLTGIVHVYRDRQGGPLAVDSPASVHYEAILISLRDGMVLWKANYAETQEALFNNLLKMGRFLRGGGVWQRSDTLARLGTERLVRTFPPLGGNRPASN